MAPVRRGRAFEKFLSNLIKASGLYPSLSFRPTGEEIDGSFWWEGRTYLLEAKWTADPIAASSIYMFKGKVDGKLIGTIGIFISMSGYSDDAVSAVQLGKSLSVILFDRVDVEAAINETSFRRILRDKLYAAGRTGEIYIPWPKLQQARARARDVSARRSDVVQPIVYVLVEDLPDASYLRDILRQRFGAAAISAPTVEFVTIGSGGWVAHSTARSMAKVLAVSTSGPGSIAIVVHGDRSDPAKLDRLRSVYEQSFRALPDEWRAQLFLVDGTVQQWSEIEQQRFVDFIRSATESEFTPLRPF